jgi:hypothetical protein
MKHLSIMEKVVYRWWWIPSIQNMLKKWLSSTTCKFFEKCSNTPKSHMHIFNVFITTVQGLKNVSHKVWEELITQSRCPPSIHHSISQMHFVQPGQKTDNVQISCETSTLTLIKTSCWNFILRNKVVTKLKWFGHSIVFLPSDLELEQIHVKCKYNDRWSESHITSKIY